MTSNDLGTTLKNLDLWATEARAASLLAVGLADKLNLRRLQKSLENARNILRLQVFAVEDLAEYRTIQLTAPAHSS